MPAVKVNSRSGAPAETDADTRVVPVFEGEPLDDAGLQSLEVVAPDGVDGSSPAERGRVVAEAQNAARDLQNIPSNIATPSFLAERAEEIAGAHDTLSVEVWDRDRIASAGMEAFEAVAK